MCLTVTGTIQHARGQRRMFWRSVKVGQPHYSTAVVSSSRLVPGVAVALTVYTWMYVYDVGGLPGKMDISDDSDAVWADGTSPRLVGRPRPRLGEQHTTISCGIAL